MVRGCVFMGDRNSFVNCVKALKFVNTTDRNMFAKTAMERGYVFMGDKSLIVKIVTQPRREASDSRVFVTQTTLQN